MAVPKRKTTPSRAGKRRSHNALKHINTVVNQTTGERTLPHHIAKDGYYGDRLVFVKKASNQNDEEAAEQN